MVRLGGQKIPTYESDATAQTYGSEGLYAGAGMGVRREREGGKKRGGHCGISRTATSSLSTVWVRGSFTYPMAIFRRVWIETPERSEISGHLFLRA